ncbi:preprotein translocase subunit SecG [Roseivivax marinus]|uniref:Protein-export membrane protein SecG n=1 Tax=Roseivivax marinus TaxID=1379903 RepID=W4HGW0_9RHOB|nr:preprotein translocase subunit SecG [Roseivivax marinus]ETW11987.1 preprotein translocase subunit SecG [Roseivivax marinus]UMA64074.1 preprotein translocase subunit SecG [Roseivivax marinus]SEK34607.1 protein translocase subunit secG [Roseivivax marinus]
MENVILIVHLLLALSLIGVVLLQRSEGGGLGMGGGGGGAMSARGAGTALGRMTWILAAAFICTSLLLTIFAAADSSGSSIMDRLNGGPATVEDGDAPASDGGLDTDGLLPPPSAEGGDGEGDAPLVPRAD